MMNAYTLLLLLCLPFYSPDTDERAEVIAVVAALFEGMYQADSNAVRATFHPEVRLHTTYTDPDGNSRIVAGDIDQFVASVGQSEPGTFNEKIWRYDVQISQNLASVWTPYTFFRGEEFSHCGVNTFQLFRSATGWQIIQIADTREREGCQMEAGQLEKDLGTLIDQWHRAAATADADAFFDAMTKDGVYIGTDASERWLRDELREWAASAFERETAWNFTPIDRVVTIAPDGRHAWWDETLNTWMGVCRATGILALTPAGWKIKHYQLSVTVPNDKIEAFQELVGQ